MNVDKYLKAQKHIESYRIQNGNTIFYSTYEKKEDDKNNNSKFWGKLFDLSYQKIEEFEDSTKSTEVWKSSFDGANIAKEQMNEWVNDTVSRIKNLIGDNCNVLEIGCGNGIIFNSIIEEVEKYTGTDVAEKGLNIIRNSNKGKSSVEKIDLYQLDALEIDQLPDHKYDLIIVNSVAQYFPSLDYVFKVFKKLEKFTSSKCHIFLGDIRSLELQKLFYFEVVKTKHPEISSAEILDRIGRMQSRENETFYSTEFFKLFPSFFDYINSTSIQLKKGTFNNELNLYRYDVTLSCEEKKEAPFVISLDWEDLKNPEVDIEKRVKELNQNDMLEVNNIPNNRFLSIKDEFLSLIELEEGTGKNKKYATVDSTIPIVSILNNIAESEQIFVQMDFMENDFLNLKAQFIKHPSNNSQKPCYKREFKQLSNRWEEKKSSSDKQFEEKLAVQFPGFEIHKVSNNLLLNP